MTNDEFQMTKEIRMTISELRRALSGATSSIGLHATIDKILRSTRKFYGTLLLFLSPRRRIGERIKERDLRNKTSRFKPLNRQRRVGLGVLTPPRPSDVSSMPGGGVRTPSPTFRFVGRGLQYFEPRRASSPRPSPPSDGGEGVWLLRQPRCDYFVIRHSTFVIFPDCR